MDCSDQASDCSSDSLGFLILNPCASDAFPASKKALSDINMKRIESRKNGKSLQLISWVRPQVYEPLNTDVKPWLQAIVASMSDLTFIDVTL